MLASAVQMIVTTKPNLEDELVKNFLLSIVLFLGAVNPALAGSGAINSAPDKQNGDSTSTSKPSESAPTLSEQEIIDNAVISPSVDLLALNAYIEALHLLRRELSFTEEKLLCSRGTTCRAAEAIAVELFTIPLTVFAGFKSAAWGVKYVGIVNRLDIMSSPDTTVSHRMSQWRTWGKHRLASPFTYGDSSLAWLTRNPAAFAGNYMYRVVAFADLAVAAAVTGGVAVMAVSTAYVVAMPKAKYEIVIADLDQEIASLEAQAKILEKVAGK